ncbi:hypothetical protein KL942_003127 [Ogataea angusta]|uniref:Vps72/YL1 C-terminal domain-containing protein n=1 Tax=Pichia angusta TaxID=870730 RepID=A0ABQ7RVM9_PICAN|nr:hypothetical protein KL942_003127 [Ogataea angusta]KAG7849149.1 hypothetical protein KL940_002831 [Ogataea angusta]
MSSSEEEFESLIATRERRSNAGSRLKKLLEAEEDEVLGEEDENVQLLFAEEGEDNEWSDESEDSEEQEEEQDEREAGAAEEGAESGSPEALSDEMLSSSELSASDTDESEGERELQKEQKRRRKKVEIPAIRRKPAATAPRKRRKVDVETGDRRLSTRTTTAQNTQAIQEKLVKMQERQSHTKTRVREEYVEKTLEENLEEAKATEEMNTLSLNLFFQQEVEKKKKQRDLMNSKRFRLMEYISFQSFGKLVTPQDELDRIREEKEREELARRTTKRRGRRRKSEIERARLEAERQEREGMKQEMKEEQEKQEKQEQQEQQEEVPGEVAVKEETGDANADINETLNGEREAEVKTANEEDAVKEETTQDTEAVEEAVEEAEAETKSVPVEGPPQRVAVQFIESHLRKDITRLELKAILFGPQSIVPGPHRDPHAQTIYTIKRDFQKELDLRKITKERDAVYEKLLQLPKFGETYHTVEDLGVTKQTDEHVISITTPAPLGIYLPNGAKKQCPINGEDAMYYDPSNGVPYNSVEGYKVLKHVAEGGYFWTQIDLGGVNSVYKGGVGCYFGRWDDRHAQGVPDGFAG